MSANKRFWKPSVPLAILPGLLCDSRMFREQCAAFEGAQVVDGFYGGAQRLADMAAYALARLPSQFVMLGHSMGARVALEIWRAAPDRVAGIVLADTGFHEPRDGEKERRYALRDLGVEQGMSSLVAQWLPPMLGRSNRGDSKLLAKLTDMCLDAGIETFIAQTEALLCRPSVEALLRKISCPALVLVGAEDEWSPPAQHHELAALIPGSRLQVVAGAGHMLPVENPGEFNAALGGWLDENLK